MMEDNNERLRANKTLSTAEKIPPSSRTCTAGLAGQCLTHCILADSSTVIWWTSPFVIFRGVRSILSFLFYFWWKILLANNADPDQMSHDVASDLGLQYLPATLLWFSNKEWVKRLKPLSRLVTNSLNIRVQLFKASLA